MKKPKFRLKRDVEPRSPSQTEEVDEERATVPADKPWQYLPVMQNKAGASIQVEFEPYGRPSEEPEAEPNYERKAEPEQSGPGVKAPGEPSPLSEMIRNGIEEAEAPPPVEEAPATVEDSPATVEETPPVVDDTPPPVEEAPAMVEEAPAVEVNSAGELIRDPWVRGGDTPETRLLKKLVVGLVVAVGVLFVTVVTLGWLLISDTRGVRDPAVRVPRPRKAAPAPLAADVRETTGIPQTAKMDDKPSVPATPAGTEEGAAASAVEPEAESPEAEVPAAESAAVDTPEKVFEEERQKMLTLLGVIAGGSASDELKRGRFQNLDQLVRSLASAPEETLAAVGLDAARKSIPSLSADKPIPYDVLWTVNQGVFDAAKQALDELRKLGDALPTRSGRNEYRRQKRWLGEWLLGGSGVYCQIRERFWAQSRGGDPTIDEDAQERLSKLQKERDRFARTFGHAKAQLYNYCERNIFEGDKDSAEP